MLICSSRDHELLSLVYTVALKVLVPESVFSFQKFNCFSHELDYGLRGSLEGNPLIYELAFLSLTHKTLLSHHMARTD